MFVLNKLAYNKTMNNIKISIFCLAVVGSFGLGCGDYGSSSSGGSYAASGTCPAVSSTGKVLCPQNCGDACYYCASGQTCSGDVCGGVGTCTAGGSSSGGTSSGGSTSSGGYACFVSCTGCYYGGSSFPSTNLNNIACGQSCTNLVNTACKGSVSCANIRYRCN